MNIRWNFKRKFLRSSTKHFTRIDKKQMMEFQWCLSTSQDVILSERQRVFFAKDFLEDWLVDFDFLSDMLSSFRGEFTSHLWRHHSFSKSVIPSWYFFICILTRIVGPRLVYLGVHPLLIEGRALYLRVFLKVEFGPRRGKHMLTCTSGKFQNFDINMALTFALNKKGNWMLEKKRKIQINHITVAKNKRKKTGISPPNHYCR